MIQYNKVSSRQNINVLSHLGLECIANLGLVAWKRYLLRMTLRNLGEAEDGFEISSFDVQLSPNDSNPDISKSFNFTEYFSF